jgi:hypothetical protein
MIPRLLPLLAAVSILWPAFLQASNLTISAGSATRLNPGEVPANYTTSHVYVDEIAGTSVPITIFFDPQTMGVETAEVFTNLNRRGRADDDANGDGIDDGILPPNGNSLTPADDGHYFKVYTMSLVSGGYQVTLNASKTGAYRLTARYKLTGNSTWIYYNDLGRRDHAIVVSPPQARDIRMYEVNTLNIEADGTAFADRSTFEDLSDRPGRIHTNPARVNQWSLGYVKGMGINWLWFQPYHPYGEEGRHLSAQNIKDRTPGLPKPDVNTWLWNGGAPYEDVNFAYALGSPYAVRNFWEIDPRMSAAFVGDPTSNADLRNATNRAAAMTAFKNFVADADAEGVNLMPDAAFNHTAWDVELGPAGIGSVKDGFDFDDRTWMSAQGASGWGEQNLIHDRELRVFSLEGDYRLRASYYNSFFDNNIAPGPDRTDFGKWLDVCDIFFGRYAALVGAQDGSEQGNYNNEGDWIDRTEQTWNGTSGGSFDAFTRATWRNFGQYVPYWLHQTRPTGQNRNSVPGDGDEAARRAWDARGIDGLRCDFGQGLPPQAWEYIINVARSYKWSFVFMAETLDGGAPPYRSNRHFDILNEDLVFAIRNRSNPGDPTQPENGIGFIQLRDAYVARRDSYGQGLVLLSTVSHDEDNYTDPWQALIRYSAHSSMDGAPMIFPGQELGISKFYGYDLMEKNFGKYIPHFKTYNSMMPIWSNFSFGLDQLYPVYAGMNRARAASPALRSSNRWFIYANGGNNDAIFSVAKYETPGLTPAQQDVVLAFANLDRNNFQWGNYTLSSGLATNIGLSNNRTYNVRNLAAYTAQNATRNQTFLWGAGLSGSHLTTTGIYVGLHKVPADTGNFTADTANWTNSPFEAQYLKLYDVTAPTATPGQPSPTPANPYAYAIGGNVTFDWADVPADSGGVVPAYRIEVTVNGSPAGNFIATTSDYTVAADDGDLVSIVVRAVNPDQTSNAGPASTASISVRALASGGDFDLDGQPNGAEDFAGTNPLDTASVFKIVAASRADDDFTVHWASVAGKKYQVWSTTDLAVPFTQLSTTLTASGVSTSYTDTTASGDRKFYIVKVVP